MKRITSGILATLLILSLTSCDGTKNPAPNNTDGGVISSTYPEASQNKPTSTETYSPPMSENQQRAVKLAKIQDEKLPELVARLSKEQADLSNVHSLDLRTLANIKNMETHAINDGTRAPKIYDTVWHYDMYGNTVSVDMTVDADKYTRERIEIYYDSTGLCYKISIITDQDKESEFKRSSFEYLLGTDNYQLISKIEDKATLDIAVGDKTYTASKDGRAIILKLANYTEQSREELIQACQAGIQEEFSKLPEGLLGPIFTEHNYIINPSDSRELLAGLPISEEYAKDSEMAWLYVTDRFNSKHYKYSAAHGYSAYNYIANEACLSPYTHLDITIDTNNDVAGARVGVDWHLNCEFSSTDTEENNLNKLVTLGEQAGKLAGATGLSEVESKSEGKHRFEYSNWDLSQFLNVGRLEDDVISCKIEGRASDKSYVGSVLLSYENWVYHAGTIEWIQQYLAGMSISDYIANT